MVEETPDWNHAKDDQQIQDSRESKYADNMELRKVHSNIYQLLMDIQTAAINIQECCSKCCISINSLKTNYMVLYNKKSKALPVQIPFTIYSNSFRTVSS